MARLEEPEIKIRRPRWFRTYLAHQFDQLGRKQLQPAKSAFGWNFEAHNACIGGSAFFRWGIFWKTSSKRNPHCVHTFRLRLHALSLEISAAPCKSLGITEGNVEEIQMSIIEELESLGRAITVAELGRYIHLGRTAIYDLVRGGRIPYFRIGYSVRFDPLQIAEWLRRHSHK